MDITGIGSIADLIKSGVDRIWPDKTKALEIKAEIDKAVLTGKLTDMQNGWDNLKGQIEVNKTEAAHRSIFVAGWRPWIGWTCGAAFAWAYVLQPMLLFLARLAGSDIVTPDLDIGEMMPVLLGMLGLAGLRTREKEKGVATVTRT